MIITDDMAEKIQSILSDEESMRQIKELAALFGGELASVSGPAAENPPSSEETSGVDTGINPAQIMGLMSVFSKSDSGCNLIAALKPLLSADKQLKADRAIKMLKLYKVYTALKDSGMLNTRGL